MPWFLFNWVYEDFEEPIALRYAKEFKHQLDNEEQAFIKTLCKGHYSFFVVLEVHLERCVIVKDIFLEKQYSVTEKQGTRYLKRGDIFFSQIVTFNNQSLFIGMAPYRVPAHYHY